MRNIYDHAAPKRATNLSVNSDLLKKAKEMDINLSSTLEAALAVQVKAKREAAWLEENLNAIKAYNQHVEAHGVFSDGARSF